MNYSFYVTGDRLELHGDNTGSVGNTYTASFDFDKAWDGYSTVAVFHYGADTPEEETITDGVCDIPTEVLESPNNFYVGVYGEKDGKRISTNLVSINIGEGAYTDIQEVR